jgi:nucleoside-diphosphate-sugar epimerase
VTELTVDIRDTKNIRAFLKLNGPFTHLIHAAAIVSVFDAASNAENAYHTNVLGTFAIIAEFLAENPTGHVTYVSSSHVYGNSSRPITESDCPAPTATYGRTKLAGEYAAADAALTAGVEPCIARLFSMYSERQSGSFLLPSLSSKLEMSGPKNELEIFGWNNVRDFSHASEHANALVHLSSKRLQGVYNVGTGKGQSVLEFAHSHLSFDHINSDATAEKAPTYVVADVGKLKATGYSS